MECSTNKFFWTLNNCILKKEEEEEKTGRRREGQKYHLKIHFTQGRHSNIHLVLSPAHFTNVCIRRYEQE